MSSDTPKPSEQDTVSTPQPEADATPAQATPVAEASSQDSSPTESPITTEQKPVEAPAPAETPSVDQPEVSEAPVIVEPPAEPSIETPIQSAAPPVSAIDQSVPVEQEGKNPASLRDKLKQAQTPEASQAVPSDQPDTPAAVDPAQAPKGPVEIPKDAEDFDAEMEAEIAAALASGEVGDSVTGTPVAEDANTEEDGDEETPQTEEDLVEGMTLLATVQTIDDENIFLDLGFRSNGLVSKRQFNEKTTPQPGTRISVRFDRYDAEEGLIHVNLPHGRKKVTGNWSELSVGQIVDALVTKTNKGGLEVTVGTMRGFMPAGQVDLVYHSDLEPFIGRKLQSTIMEANEKKRNLVVSHKAFLEIERKEKAKTLWEELAVGQTLTGYVKNLKDYGAFIDIGGADGFLHIGEMSYQHITHPKEILKEGQQVEVQIVTLEKERSRIGLSLKALQKDPWMIAAETYGPGVITRGNVTRTTKFGAFVKLEVGVEGLVHISELAHAHIGRVTDVVKVDQEIEVKVLSIDPDSRRMSLSIKELTPAPEPVRDEDLAPSGESEYQRKHKGPLKGGSSGGIGSGLFGDPSDFK
jgi:predicted RNA-binding protein with RPS1 domain